MDNAWARFFGSVPFFVWAQVVVKLTSGAKLKK